MLKEDKTVKYKTIALKGKTYRRLNERKAHEEIAAGRPISFDELQNILLDEGN